MKLNHLYSERLMNLLGRGFVVKPDCEARVTENNQYLFFTHSGNPSVTYVLWTDFEHQQVLFGEANENYGWAIDECYEVEA